MFAAAAIVAQTVWRASLEAIKWLSFKAFILGIMVVVLPFAFKPVIIYAFKWASEYGKVYIDLIMSQMNGVVGAEGIDLSYQLTGIGGYLAIQTGLIDYASIIISGWALYWTVGLMFRMPKPL